MLKIKNLTAGYNSKIVIKNLSLTARKGKITTIIGKNGCGKSTLLKSVCGLLQVNEGEIYLENKDITGLTNGERAKSIAYLSQSKDLPDVSAGRLVLSGRYPYLTYPRRYGKTDFETARKAMADMGISELWDEPVKNLSGGTRQKVYIAMALCQQAPLILMDEPTTYLDIGQQLKFSETVKSLSESGRTLLLVLHDILLALKISHSIAVMDEGKIIAEGSPEEILQSGVLEKIYGVKVNKTPDGKFYYDI